MEIEWSTLAQVGGGRLLKHEKDITISEGWRRINRVKYRYKTEVTGP